MQISRRSLLQQASILAVGLMLPKPVLAAPDGEAFSFQTLIAKAQSLAKAEYTPPRRITGEWLRNLSYDGYRDIRFKHEQALWYDKNLGYRAEFFHTGAIYLEPVEIFELAAGRSKLISYDPAMFDFAKLQVPADIREEAMGLAGFRVQVPLNAPNVYDEFLVFLGASYFRAVAKGLNYGLSARGLAVDTAEAKGEEFPMFRQFWLERPRRNSPNLTIYALLDSKSVAGAYRFVVKPGSTTEMEVSCRLFARKDIEKLGIAPLTSMYNFGENDNRILNDFRPEVHDSDGLLVNNGHGEWLWRPLINPVNLGVSSFADENPKGFGLMQRDRDYGDYQDLEAHYENRPSLWVEPLDKWGKGAVQLVEIPTDSEVNDNIVAYWVPGTQVKAGDAVSFNYRLHWNDYLPVGSRPMPVMATHVGRQFDHRHTKFVIDFSAISQAQRNGIKSPMPDLWTSAGRILNPVLMPNPHTKGWRVAFDLEPEGNQTHELRCVLRQNGKAVSETWLYQWRS